MRWGLFYLPTSLPETPDDGARRYRTLIDQVCYAEGLGFESVWLAEHHFQAFGGMFASTPMLAAAIAQRTRTMRIGTAVVLMPYHNPLRIAEDYATLDLLSGGRLEFGVGTGFIKWEALTFGVALEELRDRFREHLDIVLRAWTEPSLNYQGRFYRYENVSVWPSPLQQPHPPVWQGVTSTPESFEAAGRAGYNLMLIPLLHEVDDLAEKVQIYFRARRAAGHDVDAARVLAAYHVCVGETSGEAREAGAQGVKEYIGASGAAHALTQVEEPESFRAHLAHRSAMRSLSFDDLVERNRVLVGNAEEVRDRLRYLRERLCLTDVAGLFALGGLADEQVRASMRRFMRDVVPQVT